MAESMYASMFTPDFLQNVTRERNLHPLQNCLLSTGAVVYRTPWKNVVNPLFVTSTADAIMQAREQQVGPCGVSSAPAAPTDPRERSVPETPWVPSPLCRSQSSAAASRIWASAPCTRRIHPCKRVPTPFPRCPPWAARIRHAFEAESATKSSHSARTLAIPAFVSGIPETLLPSSRAGFSASPTWRLCKTL